jgi:cellulose synthase/poly-beta-1,6-N-acetylglucosamine synthase-like glycosyltransferase
MMWTIIISVMLLFAFSIWVIFFRSALRSVRGSPKLRSYQFKRKQEYNNRKEERQSHNERTQRLPVVSIVLAARNEQDNIQKCLNSLVRQDYQNYEIIAVNDCSTDATGEILHKIAASNSDRKITIVDLEQKPSGWVGKNWACFQGYKRSSGQVLLFTDADTIHAPDTISLTVRHMVDEKLDALTARPRITSDNTWTKIVLPLVWMVSHIAYSALKVNNPKSKTGFVFGGFYLITREVYESLGTHQSVKGEIAEDLAIGEKLKLGKHQLRMFLGEENIQASWALDSRSLHGAIQRTIVSAFRKQPILTCAYAALQAVMLISPWVVLPYAAYWFFLSSYESQAHTNGMLISILLILNLMVLGMIFTSSFALSRLSLRQGSFSVLYVLASPLACFFIFSETILSIIKAATNNDITCWKGRTYQPSREEV